MMTRPDPAPASIPGPRAPTPLLSVAPMMERTDRHFRFLLRQLSRRTFLYTEMVVAEAILRGDRDRLLGFSAVERPLALQIGGDDPVRLAACARIAADYGYDEVNLNVGCPSDRVVQGAFGACLMATPERVRDAVAAMRDAVGLPITVKHRLGIDDRDSYEDLRRFVDMVATGGCDRFTVHARTAILGGLSPRQNREIPPLRYEHVYRLKRDRPELQIEINGGILDLDAAQLHLAQVDGVMIGRAAYDNPGLLLAVDPVLHGEAPPHSNQRAAALAVLPYAEAWLQGGGRLADITRHMLGWFAGRPGARAWRRQLSTEAVRPGVGPELIERAMAGVDGADSHLLDHADAEQPESVTQGSGDPVR